jgi:transcriptional regulator with XRE-family HTH domain
MAGSHQPRVVSGVQTAPEPGLCRERVRDALRAARTARGLTQRQTAEALDWSMSKVARIEAGTVSVSVTDLQALLRLYQVGGQDEDRLIEMTRAARTRPWYSSHHAVITADAARYLDAERAATAIRGFRLSVPGLLQTPDYARTLLQATRADQAGERIALLLARQEILDQAQCPQIHYILDESVVRRLAAGPDVMRYQLARLQMAAGHPRISLGVLPFTVGWHLVADGPFTLAEFSSPDDGTVFLTAPGGRLTSHRDPDLVARYRERLETMHTIALGEADTRRLAETIV